MSLDNVKITKKVSFILYYHVPSTSYSHIASPSYILFVLQSAKCGRRNPAKNESNGTGKEEAYHPSTTKKIVGQRTFHPLKKAVTPQYVQ